MINIRIMQEKTQRLQERLLKITFNLCLKRKKKSDSKFVIEKFRVRHIKFKYID
jgi:hypothetical protein